MIEQKIAIQPISEFKAYSKLWKFFSDEHNLSLTNSEMDDIVHACKMFIEDFNKE